MSLLCTPAKLVVCCSCEDEDRPHAHIIFSDERKGTKLFTLSDVSQEVVGSLSSGIITQYEAIALINGFRDQAVPEIQRMQEKIDAASMPIERVLGTKEKNPKKFLH